MILQALNEYYDRKAADPQSALAPEGFEPKAIPFVLVLDDAGRLLQLADRREGAGKKKQAKLELVPQGVKKSVNVESNLLWGNAEYVLGLPDKTKLAERKAKDKERDYLRRLCEMHEAFTAQVRALAGSTADDPGVCAVLAFLEESRLELPTGLTSDTAWQEISESNPLLTFQLNSDLELVCQRPKVLAALSGVVGAEPDGLCLVSGKADVIERIHPNIRGVWNAQTSGANIVAVNNKNESGNNAGQTPAFASFGKQQGYNAPVGKRAAFSYTTALNHLLAKGSRQRVQVGDASTVFWAEKASGAAFEASFFDFLDPRSDDPDRATQAVASLYASVRNGSPFTEDDGQRFHVLGLAPNAARIAVRFWHVASIAEMGRAFYRYFDELDIVRPAFDAAAPLSLFRLLAATALQGKAENIPPNLGGDVMRAILSGGQYPATLLHGALRRIRAERDVTWVRAALLKAFLLRNLNDKEITVSLNEKNVDPGYRLGRLFAVLERVQERAQGNLNAAIRERYYGAFSATPVTVLPLLMKLKNHHLAKLANRGEVVNLEKLLGEVLDGLETVPARLSLAEQARFAVGYYHQRQAFFAAPDTEPVPQQSEQGQKP
jgi:CRISPR-associated protein Csd1